MALPIWQRTITTESGDVIPGAEVEVVNEATGLAADIFSNRSGTTPRTNPFFTGADGFAQFYVAPGEYRITATGPTGSITWRWNVLAGDAALRSTGTGSTEVPTNGDLGTMSTQNANNVNISGGSISGNYTGINQTAGLLSDGTTTGTATNTHSRVLIGSTDSLANVIRSSVISSNNSEALGVNSTVIASNDSTADAGRAVVLASSDSDAVANNATVVSSQFSQSSGIYSLVASCFDAKASGQTSATIASSTSDAQSTRCAVIASRRVINNSSTSLALGEATSGDPSSANRKIHLFGASGNMSIAGTLTQSATFTDFAEFMPNATGAEIEAGTLLTLDGNAVRPADEGENICGVVSHTAAILAGDTPFCWQGRYLHDEFGRRLYEDILDPDWESEIPDPDWDGKGEQPMIANPEPQPTITVLKENPDWNPELPQVQRSERPDEWTPVGLVGQVFVRTGEQVQAGDRITAKAGLGYAITERTGLKVMKVTKDFDGNYGIAKCLINVMV